MVTIEGYLKKWTNFISRWKERYFFVENGLLRYSETKNGPLKGSISLKASSITTDPNDPLRITITHERQELVVRATSIIDKYRWVKALRDNQDQASGEEAPEKPDSDAQLPNTQRAPLKTPPRDQIGHISRANTKSLTMPIIKLEPVENNHQRETESHKEPESPNAGNHANPPDLNIRLAEVLDMQSKIDRIFDEISDVKNQQEEPIRTQIVNLDGALFDLIKSVTRLVTEAKVEQMRVENMWVAIQSELDRLEGVRINVQQNDRQPQLADRLNIQIGSEELKKTQETSIKIPAPLNGTPRRNSKPSRPLEIKTNNLDGMEETKHTNLETTKKHFEKNNETVYTEAESGMKKITKMNSRIELNGSKILGLTNTEHEKTFIQDQTYFQSFVGDEEEHEEMDANIHEVLRELHSGRKISVHHNNIFETVHPRIKAIFSESPSMKDIRITNDEWREIFPYLSLQEEKLSLWSIFRESLSHDITKIEIPLKLNEPLSLLQRVSEAFQQRDLLDKADQEENPQTALALIMSFIIASYSASCKRLKKPFDPVLGETYEYGDEKDDFKLVAEQVNLKTMALYAKNAHFEATITIDLKADYWGKSVEFRLLGKNQILLKRTKQVFIFNRPITSVNNILTEKFWLDHFGVVNVKNQSTGETAVIEFPTRRSPDAELSSLKGAIMDAGKKVVAQLEGNWMRSLSVINQETKVKKTVWSYDEKQEVVKGWTNFTVQLNHINIKILQALPPTDSRLRADIRALEKGNVDLALYERKKIEEQIRKKILKYSDGAGASSLKPLWFDLAVPEGESDPAATFYEFNKKYWEEKTLAKYYDEQP